MQHGPDDFADGSLWPVGAPGLAERLDEEQAEWRKSSYSSQNGACVEVATNLPGMVAVRDTKDPQGPILVIGHDAWQAITRQIKGT